MNQGQPDAARWTRAEELFFEALELPTGERQAWLDRLAGTDPALADELRSLLAAHQDDGPVGRWGTGTVRHPERIGEYRIVRPIGEGGMGTVFLAEREGAGFRQRVALKLLRGGWSDPRLAERMQHERAILARLEHPGIARLVDGGVTEQGQPFLAMEYVEGMELLAHAREQRLPVEERVRLFLQVCDAVDYAHQQLVVHRDLKPGNIMVGLDGRVRLLDFGIATIVEPDQRTAGATQTTAWLTPAYASPEQVRGQRVSTLSDVYALGVLLYQLLAEVRPYEVDGQSPAQVEAQVCHTMPPRPSMRVESPRLRRRLAGDLDTIVLKALAKEPSRRYGSAAALGDDLRRHLEGMPVAARPAGVLYRGAKFVRRHATAVVAAALVVLALAGGGIVAARQAARARAERDIAAREAERATRVSALLVDLFRSSDPLQARGDEITARELLDQGTERIEREFGDRPDVQASLFSEVARVYANLGMLDRAESLVRRALQLEQGLGDGESLAGSAMLAQLGRIYAAQGRQAEAIATLRQAITLRAGLLAEPDTVQAMAEADLAWELRSAGEHDAAAALFQGALDTQRRIGGNAAPTAASLLLGLAATFHDAGRFDAADSLFQQVLAGYDSTMARPHPMAATALVNLGMLRRLREEYRTAEPLVRAGAAMRAQLFDPGHPDRLTAEAEWVLTLLELGRYAEAESLVDRAMAQAVASLGNEHPTTGTLREARGTLLLLTGRPAAARAVLDTGLAIRRARQDGDHPEVAIALIRAAEPPMALGQLQVAADRFREALGMAERTSGSESVYRMLALTGLGRVALARRDLAAAGEQFEAAAALGGRLLRPGHRYLLALDRERARLDLARGNREAARRRLEAVLAGERATRPEGHPRVVETEGLLAEAGRGQ